ncbi:MAG: hypothetical protein U0744_05335 [Gemmataceae bacterium]
MACPAAKRPRHPLGSNRNWSSPSAEKRTTRGRTQPDFKASAGKPVKVGVKLAVLNPDFKTPVQSPISRATRTTAQPLTLAPGKNPAPHTRCEGRVACWEIHARASRANRARQLAATAQNAPQNIQRVFVALEVLLTPKALAKVTPPGKPLKLSASLKSGEATIKIAASL